MTNHACRVYGRDGYDPQALARIAVHEIISIAVKKTEANDVDTAARGLKF